MWTQSKVNWKSTDYFNIEDWRRIRSNLEHLCEWILNNGSGQVNLSMTETGRNYEELPYVSLVNNMEKNLANLQEVFGVSFTEDVAQKTWYDRLDIFQRRR